MSTRVITAGLLLLSSFVVHAQLSLEIERRSDREAIVRGTGALPDEERGGLSHWIVLAQAFGIPPLATANNDVFVSSSLTFGTKPITFAYDLGQENPPNEALAPSVYFGTDQGLLLPGSEVSGELGAWAARP
jgi:hypothetical protein